jgi:succinoglycan biosynthesis transport protein ExoP
LAQTYVQLVRRQPILSETVKSLGLKMSWQELRDRVSAVPITGTQLIEIGLVDTIPARGVAIANELAHQLILQSPTMPSADQQERLDFIQGQLPELENKIRAARVQVTALDQTISSAASARTVQEAQTQQNTLNGQINLWQTTYAQLLNSLQQGNLNYLSVVEPASLPITPISPRTMVNVLVAAAIGLILSVGGSVLLEYLDNTIRSPEEARALVGAPILGTIGRIEGKLYPEKLISVYEPRSPLTESYRELRTNLQFSSLDAPLKKIIVTSPGPSEGKSITAANLAVVLAQAGLSVILVDADLRRPVMHRIFEVKNRVGLTSWLLAQDTETLASVGARTWGEPAQTVRTDTNHYIQLTKVPGLRIIPCGPQPPNPAEVLGSARMHQLMDELTHIADVVIFDSPPCVTVTDAVVLSRWADGVLLVLDSQHTDRQAAKHARENLDAVGAKVLGAVINRVDPGSGRYTYSYYSSDRYYYSGSRDEGEAEKGNHRDRSTKGRGLFFRLRQSKKSHSEIRGVSTNSLKAPNGAVPLEAASQENKTAPLDAAESSGDGKEPR